ncbi:MAG: GGDEF domain-containing protein [Candidatus Doudnabacteria bacterium]|nr:GGDEF domain-containing protein [Candidatus Doudnabacteria bacterium]
MCNSGDRPDERSFAELRRMISQQVRSTELKASLISMVDDLELAQLRALDNAREEGRTRGSEEERRRFDSEKKLMETYIQERERAAEDLAKRDSFTGLYNKTTFLKEILPKFIRDEARERRKNGFGSADDDPYTVLERPGLAALWVLDINHLKLVNDQFGHPMGDKMIEVLTELLKNGIRQEGALPGRIVGDDEEVSSGDTGKIGGDEFAVLQTGIRNYIEAHLAASRVKMLFHDYDWTRLDHRFSVYVPDVSVGVTVLKLSSIRGFQDRGQEISDKWFECTDLLMLKAKKERLSHITIKGLEFDGDGFIEYELNGGFGLRLKSAR